MDMAVYPPLPFTPDEEWPPHPDSEPAESSCVPGSSRAEVSTGVTAGGTLQDTPSPSEPSIVSDLIDLEFVSAGELGDSSNGTSLDPSSAPLLDSQGLIRPEPDPVVLQPRPEQPSPVLGQTPPGSGDVPSTLGSSPLVLVSSVPVPSESLEPAVLPPSVAPPSSSDKPASTSWADIVDHVEAPADPPAATASKTPIRRSGLRPPLPPRPTGELHDVGLRPLLTSRTLWCRPGRQCSLRVYQPRRRRKPCLLMLRL